MASDIEANLQCSIGARAMWVILTAIVTALSGSVIAYSFQLRSWTFQQKSRIKDERVNALTRAVEKVSSAIFTRLSRSELLNAALIGGDAKRIEDCLEGYRVYLPQFSVQYREAFAILIREDENGFRRVKGIEDEIIGPMAEVGRDLEKMLSNNSREEILILGRDVEKRLRLLSHISINTVRDLYAEMQSLRDELFDIALSDVTECDLDNLNSWNLVKLLFVRRNSFH